MKVKQKSEKVGLKCSIQKTKIMASDPITSWQMMEKQWKQWKTIFGGFKITTDGDCSYEITRHLCLGRKTMTNIDSILKSRDKLKKKKNNKVNVIIFPVVMDGCESWTIKKAECWSIDAFELWCWRLLRVPWIARRSNQSILKEISPENSLEGWHWSLKAILWPPDVKNWLIWKDLDAGKEWRWEEKGTTED